MKPPIEYRPSKRGQKKLENSSAVEQRPVKSSVSGSIPDSPAKLDLEQLNAMVRVHLEHREKFDRATYQRDYMRDKRAADKLGITVKEYRATKK